MMKMIAYPFNDATKIFKKENEMREARVVFVHTCSLQMACLLPTN